MVQNSGMVEIWQLNPSQPFTSTHFHFLIIAESATSHVLLQRSKTNDVLRVSPHYHVVPSTEETGNLPALKSLLYITRKYSDSAVK